MDNHVKVNYRMDDDGRVIENVKIDNRKKGDKIKDAARDTKEAIGEAKHMMNIIVNFIILLIFCVNFR